MCISPHASPTDRAATHAAPRRGDPRRALGRLGEQLAAAHMQRLGYAVLERNVRTRYGEIDLIAFGHETLVFAEVKTRRASFRAGGAARGRATAESRPLAWLAPRQCQRLRRLASAWLAQHRDDRPRAGTIRFDALGVTVDGDGALVARPHRGGVVRRTPGS